MDAAAGLAPTRREVTHPLTRRPWLRVAWLVWWVAMLLILCHWIYPVFYRKPVVVDTRRAIEHDPGIWSAKVAGTSASLEKAPVFGVYLVIGGERLYRRVSRFAALSRHAERHSAFFVKPGGEFLYWTLGPGITWTPQTKVEVKVPVNTRRWAWGCGIVGLFLAAFQWMTFGWRNGLRLIWARLLTVDTLEVI